MNQAIRIHENGGPEVLRLEDTKVDPPGTGEVLIRHTAVGLNFIDIYQRSGLYPLELPKVLGMEGAGVIEETGEGVEGLVPGQRVAYAMNLGAYSQRADCKLPGSSRRQPVVPEPNLPPPLRFLQSPQHPPYPGLLEVPKGKARFSDRCR